MKIVLKEFDPVDSFITSRRPKNNSSWYPSSYQIIEEFHIKYENRFKKSELKLFDILEELNGTRHQIIHRDMPDDFDPSIAAWSILAMIWVAARRYKFDIDDIFYQSSPIQIDVLNLMNWNKHDAYVEFAGDVVREEYPNYYIDFEQCTCCWAFAVSNRKCLVCFQKHLSVVCPRCGEELLYDDGTDDSAVCMSCNLSFFI